MPLGTCLQEGAGHGAPHLPPPPADLEGYERLYAFNSGLDDYLEDEPDWRVIRIPPGLSAAEVYRRLPSAPGFEYGGYLTRTRIRYQACEESRANTLCSRSCTFHSHPTRFPADRADVPSPSDIYSFLKYRHLRAVTVGASILWVFDKTAATFGTVRRLADWEAENLLREAWRLSAKDPQTWTGAYARLALAALGMKWPRGRRTYHTQWPELLRGELKIKVTVIQRFPEGGMKVS